MASFIWPRASCSARGRFSSLSAALALASGGKEDGTAGVSLFFWFVITLSASGNTCVCAFARHHSPAGAPAPPTARARSAAATSPPKRALGAPRQALRHNKQHNPQPQTPNRRPPPTPPRRMAKLKTPTRKTTLATTNGGGGVTQLVRLRELVSKGGCVEGALWGGADTCECQLGLRCWRISPLPHPAQPNPPSTTLPKPSLTNKQHEHQQCTKTTAQAGAQNKPNLNSSQDQISNQPKQPSRPTPPHHMT